MNWLDMLQAACDRTSQRVVAAELGLSQTALSLVLSGKYPASTSRIEEAVRTRYGSREDWLTALRAEVARTSQVRTAVKLGISEATVSQVLSGTYKASTLRIERRVRGALLGETCQCPVMFDPPLHVCQNVQERKYELIANPEHAQAWLACRGAGRFERKGLCPNFNGAGSARAASSNATDTDTEVTS